MAKMIRCSGENFVNEIIGNTLSAQKQTSMNVINVETKKESEKMDSLSNLKKIIMGKWLIDEKKNNDWYNFFM